MVTFDAVGNGGKDKLRTAVMACETNGASIVQQEEIPARGIFKLKVSCPDYQQAQAAVQAARFSLVFFD